MVGFDIGGTKCAVCIGKETGGELTVLDKRVIPTDHTVSPYEMIDRMCTLAEEMTEEKDCIGISCGGPLNSKEGIIIDDYSEMELISSQADETGAVHPGRASVEDIYPFFSLLALEGEARGVTIRNAKFGLEGASIGPDYQYATSNEVLPGKTAEITVEDGRLLLIKIN